MRRSAVCMCTLRCRGPQPRRIPKSCLCRLHFRASVEYCQLVCSGCSDSQRYVHHLVTAADRGSAVVVLDVVCLRVCGKASGVCHSLATSADGRHYVVGSCDECSAYGGCLGVIFASGIPLILTPVAPPPHVKTIGDMLVTLVWLSEPDVSVSVGSAAVQ